MIRKLLNLLTKSPHVHVRGQEVSSLADLVDLIDRFIGGELAYPLEWDDFVSWEHSNWHIEELRLQVASLEPLFFSSQQQDRDRALKLLLEVREKAQSKLSV